ALYLLRLGHAPYVDPPEGFHAAIAHEMTRLGDWVTPHVNGVRYFDKPPILYWIMAGAFAAAGVGEAAARVGPALAAVGIAAGPVGPVVGCAPAAGARGAVVRARGGEEPRLPLVHARGQPPAEFHAAPPLPRRGRAARHAAIPRRDAPGLPAVVARHAVGGGARAAPAVGGRDRAIVGADRAVADRRDRLLRAVAVQAAALRAAGPSRAGPARGAALGRVDRRGARLAA